HSQSDDVKNTRRVSYDTENVNVQPKYYHLRSKKVQTRAIIHSKNEIEVLMGSDASPTIGDRFKDHNYYKLRSNLIEEGIISGGKYTRNYTFDSLSAAAAVTLGSSANGRKEWVDDNGNPYPID
ncbi:MAG: DUF4357 domain-containing protein, partial [Candidatus Methanomethylophilaceae archaeon]|nr:DUF4357 domain-containing protein [Candidatus Methanomethylophilaceae archaeon]